MVVQLGNHVVSTIYLSGPISLDGRASEEQIQKYLSVFAHACAYLRNLGFHVINPCELDRQDSWEAYMKLNIPSVCESHVVATLPEWERSRGSRLEVFIARELGIPVVKYEELHGHVEPDTLQVQR